MEQQYLLMEICILTENRLSYPDTVKKGHLSMMGFDEEMKPLMR